MIVRPDGEGTVLLAGELDTLGARVLREHLESWFLRPSGRRLVLDASAVTFMDVAGLRVLVWAHERLGESGGELMLRRPSHPVLRLLDVCGPHGLVIDRD